MAGKGIKGIKGIKNLRVRGMIPFPGLAVARRCALAMQSGPEGPIALAQGPRSAEVSGAAQVPNFASLLLIVRTWREGGRRSLCGAVAGCYCSSSSNRSWSRSEDEKRRLMRW